MGSKATDGGPVEVFAALGEEAQKSVVQQAGQRQGYLQVLGRGQSEPDVLVSERGREGGRLKLSFDDQVAIGLVRRRVEDTGRKKLDVRMPVDTGLADEGDGLAEGLDGGGRRKFPLSLTRFAAEGSVAIRYVFCPIALKSG